MILCGERRWRGVVWHACVLPKGHRGQHDCGHGKWKPRKKAK